MNRIVFMGDYHARKRFPFTTPFTQLRFEAMKADIVKSIFLEGNTVFQLGDLFDSFETSSTAMIDGYQVARACEAILEGNHDLSLNTDRTSALSYLKSHLGARVVRGYHMRLDYANSVAIHLVPHCITQEKFDEAIEAAYRSALETPTDYAFLCLHTNYGTPQGKVTENYLSPAQATKLGQVFGLTISGHEHDFKMHTDRYMSLGSIVPFSFSELSDKCIAVRELSGAVTTHRVWDNSASLMASPEGFLSHKEIKEFQFIEIIGSMDVSTAVETSKLMAALYKQSPRLIAIKNSAHIAKSSDSAGKLEKPQDWVDKIRGRLNRQELDIFEQVYKEV